MAEKPRKKAKKEPKSVLGSLPATRPERIGGRRAAAPRTFEPSEAAQAAAAGTEPAPAQARAAKPRATATAKPQATAAKPKATATATAKPKAARRKAAAPRTFEPTTAAESAAGAADERAAGVQAAPRTRPQAVREGAPGIGGSSARAGASEPSSEPRRPGGTELAATAVKAAGQVAQLGLAVGGRVLKNALDRLPKP